MMWGNTDYSGWMMLPFGRNGSIRPKSNLSFLGELWRLDQFFQSRLGTWHADNTFSRSRIGPIGDDSVR